MKIKEIMTTEVETVSPTSSLQKAAAIMRGCDCGAVPVTEGRRVVGIVTDRDIVLRAVAQGEDFFDKKVSDVMSRDVVCVDQDDDVSKAEEIMEEKQIRRLIVVDRDDRLCGIVSLGDLAVEEDAEKAGEVLEKVSRPSGMSYHQNQGYGEQGQGRGV